MAQIQIADASPSVQYTVGSTPTTGPWSIPWPYFSTDDIKVYFDGTLKTITTHYTISGTAVDDGFSSGSITAVSSQNDIVITVRRDVAIERTTDFPAAGVFNIGTLNTTLDKLFAISQQFEEALERVLTLSVTTASSISNELPEPEANKVFGWDQAGTAITNVSVVGNFQGAWETSTAYILNDIVTINGNSYICIVAHTSDVFATDLASADWSILSQKGDTGPTPGLEMTWESTTTDTDQGAGKVWLNHGTPSSATVLYMDDADGNGNNINSIIDSWDDSTNSLIKGTITVQETGDSSNFLIYNVTGAVVSASTYSKITVTHVITAGTLSDTDSVAVNFVRTGDDGTMSGPGSSTDNTWARWNGTAGTSVQDGDWAEDDSGNVTAGGTLDMNDNTVSAINLKDYGEVTNALGAISGATAIDLNAGNSVTISDVTGTTTFTFSNPTASDELCGFTLGITNGSDETINWPASVDWAGGSAPTLSGTGGSVDWLVFWTVNGGTLWNGALVGAAFA